MNAVARALAHAAVALDDAGVPWALIGGLAVSCHVDPRFTRDIDIAVAVTDDEHAELLVQRLVADGYRVYTAVEQDAVARLATVRLATTTGGADGVVVDLMFASSGIESAICRDAVRLEALPGVSVPVATRGHLIATKLLSVSDERLQDAIDLRALLKDMAPADVQTVNDAIAIITERGYDRGRDLRALLRQFTRRA